MDIAWLVNTCSVWSGAGTCNLTISKTEYLPLETTLQPYHI